MNNTAPLVSICIPVYNAAKYIEQTVNCFLSQTYENIEIIIQDDYSADGTWEILNNLFSQQSKVKLFRNEKNLGIGPNWNNVYDKATGEYIVIANADDIHENTFIEKGVEKLSDSNIDFISFKYKMLFEKTSITKYTLKNEFIKSGYIENAFEKIAFENPFHIIFTIFRKQKLDEIKLNGKLFLDTQVCDAELMLRYAENRTLYYCDEVIGYYRIHETNNSTIPLGELKSYYNDVLPIWHSKLSKKFGFKYRKGILIGAIFYIKSTIKGRSPWNYKLFSNMVRFATI
ncbi:glycosyltransferase family 2 protein [Flavobacterium aquicola]|uniref:Glycosyltransferase involved in cell wall biosynthesis n=1 Tax=Flavobacterium aquicola TaxID=1682742 RepID=A0A3E0EUS8_9FLAO|nr:glycosyltransferase family 2 protein [Flavobacterium aquicola]REH01889.1 glycosyltransferase involved in cell wall biosynthesis [Flavobacterium aquicola]